MIHYFLLQILKMLKNNLSIQQNFSGNKNKIFSKIFGKIATLKVAKKNFFSSQPVGCPLILHIHRSGD